MVPVRRRRKQRNRLTRPLIRLSVAMDGLDHEVPDIEVTIEVFNIGSATTSQEWALASVVAACPNHVWYRWMDLDTGENGRNQDVFPAEEDDWDQDARGNEVDDLTGLPRETEYGPPPLYANP